MIKIHENYIEQCIKLAHIAQEHGDVPVGAIVVKDDLIVGRGENRRQIDSDPFAHAEIIAIKSAAKTLDSWNLSDCCLYVTLEPCPMCAGSVIVSRIKNVYFGAYDKELGCCGTLYNLPEDSRMNHRANVYGGILEERCSKMLSDFFKDKR